MKQLLLAAAALAAFGATPATGATLRTYQCNNSTVLRVLFDDNTATVVPYGRPSIRLTRARGESGETFRYARRSSHELRGNTDEVTYRTGSFERTCRRSGS